jgi:hypothetical protein
MAVWQFRIVRGREAIQWFERLRHPACIGDPQVSPGIMGEYSGAVRVCKKLRNRDVLF